MKTCLLLTVLLFSSLAFVQRSASAQESVTKLTLASPIGDNMVFQRGQACGVWGTATPKTQITVKFGPQSADATTDEKGHWSTKLKMAGANAEPQSLTIIATDTEGNTESRTLKNILVGDVWICSGQSNMRWTVDRSNNPDEEKAGASFPNIRLFTVANKTATEPQRDCTGEWKVCAPDTVGSFSGVGYFFGRDLHQSLDIPIGLVNNAWGGKPIEAFTSPETLATVADAKPLIAEWNAKQANYNPDTAKANYEKALANWEAKVKEIREKAKKEDKKPGRLPRKPQMAGAPNRAPNFPSAIYHEMVSPWTHTGITGAIWYQGESNRARAFQYRALMQALVNDWRKQWNQPELPFYWAQLANFRQPVEEAGTESDWAELQEAQTMAMALPNTGMAIINDIGAANDIHPRNKQDVGKRLARWALAQHYGKAIDPISGPLYERHELVDEGKAIRVHLSHTGKGLKSRDGEPLGHFELAGDDKQYVWAKASIDEDGKSVTVSSDEVEAPVAVRYAWAANPEKANLVNSAGLPANLFRTDDWKRATADRNTLAAASFSIDALRRKNAQLEKAGWEVLFNGENTEGWRNPYGWGDVKVALGEIQLTANKKFFLVTEKEYDNFHFKAEVKLPEGTANSGFMFRCHVKPNKVWGYQAEVDGSERRWSGGLYDEGRRGWVWPHKGTKAGMDHFADEKVKGALKRNDWNRYDIICNGDQIHIRVNGVTTTKIKDATDAKGFLALQHHGEKGAVYRFRNVMVKPIE